MMLKVHSSFQLKYLFHVEIAHRDLCDDWHPFGNLNSKAFNCQDNNFIEAEFRLPKRRLFSFYINCLILLALENVSERTFVDKYVKTSR